MPRSIASEIQRNGYQDVASALRTEIKDGVYTDGTLLPTERELQSRFQVSRTTVRRALQALVESGWAESSPNRGVLAKRGKAVLKTTNVAFIDHSDTVNQVLFLEINRLLQEQGLHLVHVDSRKHTVEGALAFALEEEFAAIVIWPKKGYLHAPVVEAVFQEIPVVCVQHEFLNVLAADLVTEDHLLGGWIAADHLVKQGRKRVAVTGMLDMLRTNHLRFSGYMLGLFHARLNPNSSDYVFCYTSNQDQPDMRLLEQRLKDQDRPDAVFVLDDFLVPYVVETVQKQGLKIPQDVAIVAFGNDVEANFAPASLTTVSIDWKLVAAAIAEQIKLRLGGDHSPPRTVKLPVRLIVRGSCGAPKEQWADEPFFVHANSLAYARPQPEPTTPPEFGAPFPETVFSPSSVTNGGQRHEK